MKFKLAILAAVLVLVSTGGVAYATRNPHHNPPHNCEEQQESHRKKHPKKDCEEPVVDVCTNIEGNQAVVPEGKVLKDEICVAVVVEQPPVQTPAQVVTAPAPAVVEPEPVFEPIQGK